MPCAPPGWPRHCARPSRRTTARSPSGTATRATWSPAGPRGRRDQPCTVRASRPRYGRRRDAAVARGAGAGRRRVGRDRHAVRRGPGSGRNGRRHAVPGVHAVLPRPGASTAGRRPAAEPARPAPGRRRTTTSAWPRCSTRRCATARTDLPERRRGGRAASAGEAFRDDGPRRLRDRRDRPDLDGTSRLSPYLKSARSTRARCSPTSRGRTRQGRRDVHRPSWPGASSTPTCSGTARTSRVARPAAGARGRCAYDEPRRRARGVARGPHRLPDRRRRDAPAAAPTGWMHNRVRMITASFLAKDLHVWWPRRRPALPATTWSTATSPRTTTAGSGWPARGTDAAPYFRVFNPVTQGAKFDPDGDYVRRWVPELAHLPGKAAHEPWERRRRLRARLPAADRRPRRGAARGAGALPGGPGLRVLGVGSARGCWRWGLTWGWGWGWGFTTVCSRTRAPHDGHTVGSAGSSWGAHGRVRFVAVIPAYRGEPAVPTTNPQPQSVGPANATSASSPSRYVVHSSYGAAPRLR